MACLQRWQHTQTQKQQEPQGAEEGGGSEGGVFLGGGSQLCLGTVRQQYPGQEHTHAHTHV